MALRCDTETVALAETLKTSLATRLFGRAAKRASYLKSIPRDSNVCGFGYGSKTTGTSLSAETAVRVYVRVKLPKGKIPNAQRVPEEIDGVPTDVIATGDLRALGPRPVEGGGSISLGARQPGTLGCLVEDGTGRRFILSNNHVLANTNTAKRGDNILEPASIDGGDSFPPIATLSDFEPIRFAGAVNHIDAAIAALVDLGAVLPEIASIGRVTPQPLQAVQHMSVVKHGRTTQRTLGVVMDIAADTQVRYGIRLAHFERQIAVGGVSGPFSDGGDSGALVVDAITKRPVALLFSGGPGLSFCNPIDLVLSRFGVSVV